MTNPSTEISWRTVLRVPEAVAGRFCQIAAISPESARQKFAQDAMAYGYRYISIGDTVWSIEQPPSLEQLPIVTETEIKVDPETGEFRAWVVHQNLRPLTMNGQVALFLDPKLARFQAARNAGEALPLEDFLKKRTAEAPRVIVPTNFSKVG